jgi:PAS domain S-box-containing protein
MTAPMDSSTGRSDLPRGPAGATADPVEHDEAWFVRRRMPLFAGAWLASSVIWSGLLVFDEGFRASAILTALAAELVLLALMLLGRAIVTSLAEVRALALAATVVVGWIVLALFVHGHGSRDVLGVTLLTLYVLRPLRSAGAGAGSSGRARDRAPAGALLASFAPSVRPAERPWPSLSEARSRSASRRARRGTSAPRTATDSPPGRMHELLASRDAYRDLAENVEDLIWSFDLAGRWTYLNAAAERFFGRSRDQLIGRLVTECVVPGSAYPPFQEGLARMAAGEPARIVRIHCVTAQGPRWIEAFGSGIFAADGTLAGMRGVGRDVTERIAIDTRLAESEAKFRMVAEAITTPLFVFQGTRLRYVNAAAVEMMGYSEAEHLAMPFWDLLHPDDRALARERGMARQRGEQFPPSLDYRVRTKSGETRWVEFTAVPTEFEGAPAILGTAVDVTERKRAESALQASLDELRRSEERLRRLARHQVHIRDDERKRLGFDLHDGVCQELIGVAIMIHAVRERLGVSDPGGAEVLEARGRLPERRRRAPPPLGARAPAHAAPGSRPRRQPDVARGRDDVERGASRSAS